MDSAKHKSHIDITEDQAWLILWGYNSYEPRNKPAWEVYAAHLRAALAKRLPRHPHCMDNPATNQKFAWQFLLKYHSIVNFQIDCDYA